MDDGLVLDTVDLWSVPCLEEEILMYSGLSGSPLLEVDLEKVAHSTSALWVKHVTVRRQLVDKITIKVWDQPVFGLHR